MNLTKKFIILFFVLPCFHQINIGETEKLSKNIWIIWKEDFDDNNLNYSRWSLGYGGNYSGDITEKDGILSITLGSANPKDWAQLFIVSKRAFPMHKTSVSIDVKTDVDSRAFSIYLSRDHQTKGDPHNIASFLLLEVDPKKNSWAVQVHNSTGYIYKWWKHKSRF